MVKIARFNNSIKVVTDNTDEIIKQLNSRILAFLEEAGGEVVSQAKRNSRVDTGQLKSSWTYRISEKEYEVHVGSPLMNAIYEEFGTGIYAVGGDGRKTKWKYKDIHGKWHTTSGKKPNHTLERAFNTKKRAIKKQAENILRGM